RVPRRAAPASDRRYAATLVALLEERGLLAVAGEDAVLDRDLAVVAPRLQRAQAARRQRRHHVLGGVADGGGEAELALGDETQLADARVEIGRRAAHAHVIGGGAVAVARHGEDGIGRRG